MVYMEPILIRIDAKTITLLKNGNISIRLLSSKNKIRNSIENNIILFRKLLSGIRTNQLVFAEAVNNWYNDYFLLHWPAFQHLVLGETLHINSGSCVVEFINRANGKNLFWEFGYDDICTYDSAILTIIELMQGLYEIS